MRNKIILFSIMGWGLGHATRCIPIIKALKRNNKIILSSNGNAKILLQVEFPDLKYIAYPDYAIKYPKIRALLIPYIFIQLPKIIISLFQEYFLTSRVVKNENINIIISDSRYGVFSQKVPSFLILHQLQFQLNGFFSFFQFIGEWFNTIMFKNFTKIIIPDVIGKINLTGNLTHKGKISKHPKLNYLGVFCNVNKLNVVCDIDYLFSISGPEIQRTLFEEIILDQIKNIPGKKVVVLGNPTSKKTFNSYDDIEIYNHVDRIKQNEFLNRAKFVICRSGYTTVMELVALKKPALMIPTPGQTEQEYLASHYRKLNIFYVAQQKNLNLALELKYVEKNNLFNIGKFPINKIQGLIDVL